LKFISLLTDFGTQDGYTGVMKGVIYRISPDAQIADISHTIRPQNVLEGSLVWTRSYSYFPEGTIHVAVIDPGVGTHRRAIAARLGLYFFVCPDNGLITPILEEAEKNGDPVEIVVLDQPRFWLPQVSTVFHGRDIFAPVSAYLANGVPLKEFGTPINDPARQHLPEPRAFQGGWRGEVINIDHFGNLGTNVTREQLKGIQNIRVRAGDHEIDGLVKTFGEKAAGELVSLIDSDNCLAISIVNGNAAKELGLDIGDPVEVILKA